MWVDGKISKTEGVVPRAASERLSLPQWFFFCLLSGSELNASHSDLAWPPAAHTVIVIDVASQRVIFHTLHEKYFASFASSQTCSGNLTHFISWQWKSLATGMLLYTAFLSLSLSLENCLFNKILYYIHLKLQTLFLFVTTPLYWKKKLWTQFRFISWTQFSY